MPICTRCKQDKPEAEFSVDLTKKSGLCSWCKVCKYAHNKAWFAQRDADRGMSNHHYKARHVTDESKRCPSCGYPSLIRHRITICGWCLYEVKDAG